MLREVLRKLRTAEAQRPSMNLHHILWSEEGVREHMFRNEPGVLFERVVGSEREEIALCG